MLVSRPRMLVSRLAVRSGASAVGVSPPRPTPPASHPRTSNTHPTPDPNWGATPRHGRDALNTRETRHLGQQAFVESLTVARRELEAHLADNATRQLLH